MSRLCRIRSKQGFGNDVSFPLRSGNDASFTHRSHHFHPVSNLFPVYSCVFGMFLGGFQHRYCVRKSKAGYFQLSTLIWLVGLSLMTLPHHVRSPLWCSCLPGSRSCPGLELAGGRVWCLKSQWMQ